MRTLEYCKRLRRRKRPTTRTINLTVEALEPRMVLSAAGFGLEGAHERFDFGVGDHGSGETHLSAFAEQQYENCGNQRFELSARHADGRHADAGRRDVDSQHPRRDRHTPDRPLNQRLARKLLDGQRREPQFEDRSPEPVAYIDNPEGESSFGMYDFADFSSYQSFDEVAQPDLFTATVIPRATVVFVASAPISFAALGGDLLDIGQPTTTPTPPPQTATARSSSPPSSSASTLLASLPVSSPASNGPPSATLAIQPSSSRFGPSPSANIDISLHSAIDSASIAETSVESFVSQSTTAPGEWWNAYDESFDRGFTAVGPGSIIVGPRAEAEPVTASLNDSVTGQLARLSDDSLWAGVGEGGFIEIDTNAAASSRDQFEFTEDFADIANSKRPLTGTPRGEFWFDLGDARFDSVLDSAAMQELSEEQISDDVTDAEEEAWLLEEGGMIVLTSSQFTDNVVDVTIDETRHSSPSEEAASDEIDIPMDEGIGVFQAIEVATTPVEHQDDVQASTDASAPSEGEVTADADDSIPSAGHAAENSESGKSDPVRAASMPLLLAISAFLARNRNNRDKPAKPRRKV